MSKHIVIGLGGTGLTMVRAMRCIVSQELEQRDELINGVHLKRYYSPDSDIPHDVQLRYLEVDTSTRDLKEKFEGCSPATGPSLLLGDNYQHNISATDTQGANMRRDMGARLFCAQAAAFDKKIKTLMAEVGGSEGLHFHICAGLGGGTGSGSIVDVVCRLRQLCQHNGDIPSSAKIHLYVYLPHRNFPYAQDQYEPNGYAALAELSSLNTRQWTPMDKNPGNAKPIPYKFESADPTNDIKQPVFENCYIFEQNNENGYTYKTGSTSKPMKDQVGQLFGYFLFEKCFVWPRVNQEARGLINGLERADCNENLEDFQFEYSYDMDTDTVDASARVRQKYAIHSNRFQAIGFKSLVVPVLEMKRHYAAVLANEGLLRLRYNEPSASGFLDPEAELDTPESKEEYQKQLEMKVGEKLAGIRKELVIWKLKEDGILTGQEGILGNEDSVKIKDFWEEEAYTLQKDIARNTDNAKSWLIDMEDSLCATFKDSYYCVNGQQPQGVEEYYKKSMAQINNRVRAHMTYWVKDILLKRLFSDSPDAKDQMCLLDMHLVVRALVRLITGEGGSIESCIKRLNKLSDKQNGVIVNLEDEKDEILEKYNKLGFIGRKLYRENYLQDFARAMGDYMTARTEEYAYKYATKYLEVLSKEVAGLEKTVTDILSAFDNTLRGVINENSGERETEGIQALIHSSCPLDYDIHAALEGDICVKLYDPEVIRENDKKFRTEKELVQVYQTNIRSTLLRKLLRDRKMEELTLQDLATYFDGTDFKQTLIEVCLDTINKDERFAFALDFNINKEIRRLFVGEGQDRLGDIIHTTSGYAAGTASGEINAHKTSNAPITKHWNKTTASFVSGENRELIGNLTNRLRSHMGNDVSVLNSRTQLIVTRIENGLPVRAFRRTRELYNKYETLRRENAKITLHTDGANEPFPQFFPEEEEILTMYRGSSRDTIVSSKDITDAQTGSLFKRYLMGWVYPGTNPVTNVTYWSTPMAQTQEMSRRAVGFVSLEDLKKRPSRRLTEKLSENFIIDDYLKAVHDSVEQASAREQDELNPFSMTQLYREMKETQEAWLKIVKPEFVDERVMDQRRAAMERLQTAVEAVQARYVDPGSPQYRHAALLYNHYGRALGML